MLRKIPALKVKQWLKAWDEVDFKAPFRSRPEPHFYVFSINAGTLRRLADIRRRTRHDPKQRDTGIQRRHDDKRSAEIAKYIEGGLPWSTLGSRNEDFPAIRMPGWLPTAIVINLRTDRSSPGVSSVHEDDRVRVRENKDGAVHLDLPEGCEKIGWRPRKSAPVEVIDGQHRLWAFEESNLDFELPVVAFYGLDIGWQAYLFWTINVKPKRISPSLAFDLYPLLRTQAWLEAAADGPLVYRETRAQELTEALWAHPKSPWYERINMLGEPGQGDVSQAAFIRSLTVSYVKRSAGKRVSIGGLFGSEIGGGQVLGWSRSQQAAFLIVLWQHVRESVTASQQPWAKDLIANGAKKEDLFSGPHTLLATDQGVRAVLQVTNDMCMLSWESFELDQWSDEDRGQGPEPADITGAMTSYKKELLDLDAFVTAICKELARFDWRTSAAPGLDRDSRLRQAAYRGSGGYKELRVQLLRVLATAKDRRVARVAREAASALSYDLN